MLDILLTSRPSLMGRVDRVPGVIKKYWPAHYIVKARKKRPAKRKIYLWNRSDTDSIRDEMGSFSQHFVLDNSIHTPVDED